MNSGNLPFIKITVAAIRRRGFAGWPGPTLPGICFALAIIALVNSSSASAAGHGSAGGRAHNAEPKHHATPADAQHHLKEVEKKRQANREKLAQARRKEQLALAELRKIKKQLHHTTKALNTSQHQLKKTESTLVGVQVTLKQTESKEQQMTGLAARRLREMYEGQRLGLLEMLFQASSLEQLMDLLYYQERIAEMDRKLLSQLRAKEQALAAQKNRLGNEKVKLGDIVSEFARKALMLNKEKSEQEQVADKLRTQRAFYEAAEGQLARESSQLESQIMAMMKSNDASPNVVTQGSGTLAWPIKAQITSPFGYRRHPIFGIRKFHSGIDLAGKNHSPIKASDSGNVLYAGWYGGYGKVVIVGHGNGLATLYAHLSKAAVAQGTNVSKGQVIGYEGSTGFSTGPHLHFEVRVNGKPNNPLNFVR